MSKVKKENEVRIAILRSEDELNEMIQEFGADKLVDIINDYLIKEDDKNNSKITEKAYDLGIKKGIVFAKKIKKDMPKMPYIENIDSDKLKLEALSEYKFGLFDSLIDRMRDIKITMEPKPKKK